MGLVVICVYLVFDNVGNSFWIFLCKVLCFLNFDGIVVDMDFSGGIFVVFIEFIMVVIFKNVGFVCVVVFCFLGMWEYCFECGLDNF